MPYEADIIRQPGSLIDGDMRLQAKVEVLWFKTPTSKGEKVGTALVKSWTPNGLRRAGKCEADNIKRRHIEKRREEITRKIQRLEQAQGVSLE